MFWKKKQKIDLEIPDQEKDNREAFRVQPDPVRPIILTLAGNSYPVANISGNGCCFRSHNFPEGFEAACTIRIPSDDIIFPVSIRVISRKRDLCHCAFSKISPKAEDAIHAYVLKVQKDLIRNK